MEGTNVKSLFVLGTSLAVNVYMMYKIFMRKQEQKVYLFQSRIINDNMLASYIDNHDMIYPEVVKGLKKEGGVDELHIFQSKKDNKELNMFIKFKPGFDLQDIAKNSAYRNLNARIKEWETSWEWYSKLS